MFLARVAHESTVDARATYVDHDGTPSGTLLLRYNEFIHGVTDYMVHVLERSELKGEDTSVMEMIFDVYGAGVPSKQQQLAKWLQAETGPKGAD